MPKNADKTYEELLKMHEAKVLIENMVKECAEEMLNAGIPVQYDRIALVGTANLVNTHAVCAYRDKADGMWFTIVIHEKFIKYMNDPVVIANVRNSIYHELLHTIVDAQAHNEIWMKWSNICDEKLGTTTKKYLEDAFYYNTAKSNGFIYHCPHCGNIYQSTDKFVGHIECQLCNTVMNI